MTLSGRTKLDCYALPSPGMRRSANYRSRTRPTGLEWERRLTATQVLSIVAVLVSAAALCGACLSAATEHRLAAPAICDSDPSHIWNRTYGCLFVRQSADGTEYGAEALDPLLWWQTRYLLTGDSHRNALACLDEFLHRHAERAVHDPLKRAVFRRDLWAVFDWAAAGDDLPQQRRELEMRLAEAIRRVVLTPDQVRALPDTCADAVAAQQFAAAYDSRNPQQPFLPPELLRPGGPWVCLSAHAEEPTADGAFCRPFAIPSIHAAARRERCDTRVRPEAALFSNLPSLSITIACRTKATWVPPGNCGNVWSRCIPEKRNTPL
jgi:hypothetical protein